MKHTIDSIRQGLLKKQFSAVELTKDALAEAEQKNPEVNGYLTFCPERALAAAEAVDQQIAIGGVLGQLAGVPVGVKDVILTKDVRTTCASKLLEHYIPPYDATAVQRLEKAGGIIIGKTNCDEFAMGSSNENSAFGPVKNPAAPDRVPGGSSGGSAAVVAQETAVVSLGSDTGGSIRQPASFCGVTGVTPTYGRVSRYGLTAFASSLDHIGPFSRNVRDSARLLQVIAGRDEMDATSAAAPVDDYVGALTGDIKGMKLGVPQEWMAGLENETGDLIQAAIDQLKSLGAEIHEVHLPHTEYAIGCYYIICTAEASANLARYDGVRYTSRSENVKNFADLYRLTRDEGFGDEVKRRIMLGTYVLSAGYYEAYYLKAEKVRSLVMRDYREAFQQVDAIVGPVSPHPAFKLGAKVDDPTSMYLSDIYTVTGDLAGIPCMSVPCGKTAEGLPVGLQVLANHFDEARMFRIADAYERSLQ